MADQLHTAAEAAGILKVRESWLKTKAAARLIPCTFIGKHLRFSDDNIAEIMKAVRPVRRPRLRGRIAGLYGISGGFAQHCAQHRRASRATRWETPVRAGMEFSHRVMASVVSEPSSLVPRAALLSGRDEDFTMVVTIGYTGMFSRGHPAWRKPVLRVCAAQRLME